MFVWLDVRTFRIAAKAREQNSTLVERIHSFLLFFSAVVKLAGMSGHDTMSIIGVSICRSSEHNAMLIECAAQ